VVEEPTPPEKVSKIAGSESNRKGIDPPAQVPQRDIIDAQMAFFGRFEDVALAA